MKRIYPTAASFSREFIVLGFFVVLCALALIGTTATSARTARPALVQGKEKPTKAEPLKVRSDELIAQPFDYEAFVAREKNGEIPDQTGPAAPSVLVPSANVLVNNNAGASGTGNFTQSETTILAFGTTVIVAFNDSGSNAGGANKFTGVSRSTDGGATFTDGGSLPTNANGDAGDPALARSNATGRIFLSTLTFADNGLNVFHSDDNGATWSAPVQGTPGKTTGQDKDWLTVDNFAGAGNGNVYLVERDFGAGNGIFLFRSTDNGNTFGPSGGVNIVSSGTMQGAFVAVGPDHAVYVFWYAGTTLQVRKSSDLGLTFGAPVTVASGLVGGTNGDLGLMGIRQGTATASAFRTSEFPHAAVNPINGNLYCTFANKGAGSDKADIFLVQSTTGGASWGAPIKVNDDATTTDQWQPTLATDGTNLGIFYYSRQEDPVGNNLYKYYGRIADIAGATLTFQPSFAVSDTASLPEFGRDTVVNSTYMGDYDFAFALNGAIHVSWADNRNDLSGGAPRKDPNVYYSTVNLKLHVTSTVPAFGSVVFSQPTVFTVNVSEPVDPATVQAADFTVNGIPASSFSYTPGTSTMTFTFASTPVTAQGLQTMHISAGAFTSAAAGDPVAVFDASFRYDVLLLQVVSTSPPFPNGVFTLPSPLTYDVNFNEAIDPASVSASDLTLTGIASSSVTAVTVLPGNMTARFTLSVPAEGTLTASIAAGAITDAFGNPGAAFSANYVVDIGTVPYPVPLTAKNPSGSLIYDPSIAGTIAPSGDTDSFTLAIDPGQTITVLVSSSAGLQPSVTLRDPSSTVLASATAGAANQNALLQTVPAVSGGTYTITVEGAGGSTGNYTVRVILNAAQEEEDVLPGVNNNSLATAQDLNASFINLQTSQASAQRGAVLGTPDSASYTASAVPFAFEDISATGTVIAGLTNQDDASVSIPIGFTFPFFGANNTTVFISSNGLLTFGSANTTFTNADLTTSPTQAAIAPFWDDQHTGGGLAGSNVFSQVTGAGPNQHVTIQWNQVRFFSGGTTGDTITYQAQLFADGRIQLNYADLVSGTAAGNNGASATVGIKDAGTQGPNRLLLAFNNGPNAFVGTGQSTLITPPTPVPDFYSFTLAAGDVTTLAAKAQSPGTTSVTLLDSLGNVLANGVGGSVNLDSVINNFVAPSAGTYYARMIGTASYSLVVTRNAAFDTEANDTAAAAQPIDGNRGALGAISLNTSYSASAVPFAFEDISATGTVIAGLTNQDDASVSIPIGFTFPLFGVNNTTVFISSNGLLTFGSGNTTFTNADLTTSPTQAAIAPFWDDQNTGGGLAGSNVFSQVTGAGPNQHVTIQWNQVRFFSGGTTGDTITYQAQLFADGRIQLNYADLVSGTAAGNNGASATVGIKDAGTQGPNRLLLAFNNGPNAFVGTGQSTLISPLSADDWYTVNVGATGNFQAETSTPADGPGEFVNTLNPHIELYDPSNVLIASGTPLADGRNESIVRSGLAPGTYRIRVSGEGGTLGEYFLTASGGAPVLSAAGSVLVNESCPPVNGAVDPGETATLNLNLQNIGGTSTTNLVATLQSSANVLSPSGPQTYGAISPGGIVGRNFSFTANGSVGQVITLTLQLQDGATNLGTASYNITLGNNTACAGAPRINTAVVLSCSGSDKVATITISNGGTANADNVMLTTAKLGGVNGIPLPQAVGTLAPGASSVKVVTFTGAPSGVTTLQVGGTYNGGTFNSSRKLSAPTCP